MHEKPVFVVPWGLLMAGKITSLIKYVTFMMFKEKEQYK
jgi:hypothetical protein